MSIDLDKTSCSGNTQENKKMGMIVACACHW